MAKIGTEHSSVLLAAQNRLFLLRKERQVDRVSIGSPATKNSNSNKQVSNNPVSTLPFDTNISLPDHLGWESSHLTASIRNRKQKPSRIQSYQNARDLSWLIRPSINDKLPGGVSPSSGKTSTIKLHPDIALGILRQDQSSAGRLWLLFRHIDHEGRGWITVNKAREHLTGKQSELRVCGWRQLRNLLSQGESIFWHRYQDRIWLRSVAKVAAALNVHQLKGAPVEIPLATLTQGIGLVRAHFYASFHSGRLVKSRSGAQKSMPIARKTIKKICRISRRTQRSYEKLSRVRRQENFAIGLQNKPINEQETAWRQGQAYFHLIDRKGKLGNPGNAYLAWQLPNTYFGPHAQQPRGQQKRINQELADLFTQGMTGNGKEMVEGNKICHPKRFYGNGRLAAKTINKPANQDVYWQSNQQSNGRLKIWHYLGKS